VIGVRLTRARTDGVKVPVRECSQAASHSESQSGPSTRPRQLRNREVPWEGNLRSKLMSRRTERPYKVDGTGQLAPHSVAPRSVPEINGPVVQQEFTSLLRETCNPSSTTPSTGATASNDHRAAAGVSRGRSTEGNEPVMTGWSHNSGRAELGRQSRPSVVLPRSDEADWLSNRAAIIVAEKEWLLRPLRTARNRRTRTRRYGGVGGGGSNPRSNPPADPIRHCFIGQLVARRQSLRPLQGHPPNR
jgi:hypothetical protein